MQLFQLSEATAAQRRLFFHAVDATDGITAETGLTGTGFVSENGATPAASASIVEINATNMPGRYYVVLTAAELGTVGDLEFRYKAAACAEVIARGQVVPFDPYDVVRLGLTAMPNAAAQAAGGLYTRGTGAGQVNQDANGRVDVNLAAISTSAPAADLLERGALGIVFDTAKAGTLSVTQMSTNLTQATNDHYKGRSIVWLDNVLAGQSSKITAYVGTNGVLTYDTITDIPSAGDAFIIV